MLPYAGSVDPESTLAIGVHHVGHLEETKRFSQSTLFLPEKMEVLVHSPIVYLAMLNHVWMISS